jgi:hypothetical protein
MPHQRERRTPFAEGNESRRNVLFDDGATPFVDPGSALLFERDCFEDRACP